MKADLHIHTIKSDGDNTVEEIIKFAKAREVSTIAITDHDTTEALKALPNDSSIEIIPGIELSTQYQGKSVHVLGYFIDPFNKDLNVRLKELREKRKTRAKRIVSKLKEIENIIIDYDKIKREQDGDSSIGRPHIASEMVNAGYVKNVRDAFKNYIGDGMSCYVPNEKLTVSQAIELIKESGGIAFLAHPGIIKDVDDYSKLLEHDFEGIEVFHPKHLNEQRQYFYDLAIKRNLLISGGSDFHSRKIPGKNKIASAYISEKYLLNIKEYYNSRKE